MKFNKNSNMHSKLLSIRNADDNDDFTIKYSTWIIQDDSLSGNGHVVNADVLLEGGKSLLNKPLVCKYHEASDNNGIDALGSHEVVIKENRNGEVIVSTDTIAIGHFITEGRIESINGKNCLVADAVLYAEKYPDVIELLEEWNNRNIPIVSSSELYYYNYRVENGIEYVDSPIVFSAHCVLNSEERGLMEKVYPAYDSSKLTALNSKNKFNDLLYNNLNFNKNALTEENKTEYISRYELISNWLDTMYWDSRQFDDVMEYYRIKGNELYPNYYFHCYPILQELYDDYAIITVLSIGGNPVINAKVSYIIDNNNVVIFDFDNLIEVENTENKEWNAKMNKDKDLVTISTEEYNALVQAKNDLTKVNNEKIELLNTQVEYNTLQSEHTQLKEDLETIKNSLETAENKLKEIEMQKEFDICYNEFKEKFEKVGANELFEKEIIQNSIKDFANGDLNGKVVILDELVKATSEIKTNNHNPNNGLGKEFNDLLNNGNDELI